MKTFKNVTLRKMSTMETGEMTLEALQTAIKSGWTVECVDGPHVVGMCEVCGLPITIAEKFWRDTTGIYWHKTCNIEG